MKIFTISRLLLVVFFLYIGIQIVGCGDDDPKVPEPKAAFSYTGTNDFRVTCTVTFTNESTEATSYQWDFGNGETSAETNPTVTYREEGAYSVSLIATGDGGSDQIIQEITIGSLQLQTNDLIGIWSIVREEVTSIDGVSTSIIHDRPMNWETLQFFSDAYQRLSLTWVEEELGSYTLNENFITLIPGGGGGNTNVNVSSIDENEIAAVVTFDSEEGSIEINVTLEKNGSEYFEGSPPGPYIEDFAGYKWSVLEETIKYFSYSEETNEYSDLIDSETESDITYNYMTIFPSEVLAPGNLIWIDNWYDGVYQRLYHIPYWTGNYLVLNDEEMQITQIVQNHDGNNVDIVSVRFTEVNGNYYREEVWSKLLRNHGTEAIIAESDLIGDWKVTDKTETSNGVSIDPLQSSSPPVGFTLTFHADGSATLGDPNPGGWFALDESNFVVVSPAMDETLIHVLDYDSMTGVIEVMSITSEDGSEYYLWMTLEKQ